MRSPSLRRMLLVVVPVLVALGGCTTPEPDAAPTVAPTRAVSPSPSPEPQRPSPSPTGPEDPLPTGPVDVLLIGTDSRDPQSLGGNADTIMLAHVPADREKLYLVSFTRDMWVPIPGIGKGKINSAFARGGTPTLVDTVSGLLGGVDIDYAVQTNFNGFIALTRALGGIEVDNQHASTVTVLSTGRVVEFPEGRITLENTDGLIYVRERKTLPLGDLDRTERQRATVTGMVDGIGDLSGKPAKLARLIPLLAGNVKVTGDLDADDFRALVPMAAELERDDVVGLMVPITGFGNVGGASVNLVDEAQTAALGKALRRDRLDRYVREYGTDYSLR